MVFPYPGLWAPGATSRSGLLVQFSSWWLCKVSQYFPQELLGKLLVDHQALETMVLYLEAPVYSKWVCLKIEYPQNFIKFHGVYCISSFSHTFPIHIYILNLPLGVYGMPHQRQIHMRSQEGFKAFQQDALLSLAYGEDAFGCVLGCLGQQLAAKWWVLWATWLNYVKLC